MYYVNYVSVFLDRTKVTDFQWNNAGVSRTQGVCHVIYIFFWFSLDKVGQVLSF